MAFLFGKLHFSSLFSYSFMPTFNRETYKYSFWRNIFLYGFSFLGNFVFKRGVIGRFVISGKEKIFILTSLFLWQFFSCLTYLLYRVYFFINTFSFLVSASFSSYMFCIIFRKGCVVLFTFSLVTF